MGNKCAWCQIDTDKQQKFMAEISEDGRCPDCGSYNDCGQRRISINSMKQIYAGALRLMSKMADEFSELLEIAGVDIKDLRSNLGHIGEQDPLEIHFYTSVIVRELFLSHTDNAGGTSTGNLKGLLGIEDDSVFFEIWESEEDE